MPTWAKPRCWRRRNIRGLSRSAKPGSTTITIIPTSAGKLLDAMGIAADLRTYAAIQSHWYSPLAEGGFQLDQPVGLFPRLELPADEAAD